MHDDEKLSSEVLGLVRDWGDQEPPADPFRDDQMLARALAAYDDEAPDRFADDDITDVDNLGGSRRYWPLLVAAALLSGSVVAWRIQAVNVPVQLTATAPVVEVLVLRADVGLVVDVVEARPVRVELPQGGALGLQGRGRVVVEGIHQPAVRIQQGRLRAEWAHDAPGKTLEVRGGGRRFTQTQGEASWQLSEGRLTWTAISATVASTPSRSGPVAKPVEDEGVGNEGSGDLPAPEDAPLAVDSPPPLGLIRRTLPHDEQLFGQALQAVSAGAHDSALLLVSDLAVEHPDSQWMGPAMIIRADALRVSKPAEARQQYELYLSAYPQGHEVPSLHRGNLRAHASRMVDILSP